MGLSVKSSNSHSGDACKIARDYEILKNAPIFQGADPEVLKLIAYLAERKRYQVGDRIIRMDREADKAFYLVSGSVHVTTFHNKREVILQNLKQGSFCGELALLAQFKWFFNVHPLEECEAIIITRKSFQKVLDSFPEKREKMIEKIIQLRVSRFIEQTDYMLDTLPDEYLEKSIWSPSKIAM